MNSNSDPVSFEEQKDPPIFNLPGIILFSLVVLLAIHVVRETFLSEQLDLELLVNTAFIPQRYVLSITEMGVPYVTSAFTYSLLHGGYSHLIVNGLWLAAFGSIVARRWGTIRFCVFWVLSAIASAAFFAALNWGEVTLVIGASGVVSALMGAATRFAFPLSGRFIRDKAHFLPRQSFLEIFQNKTVLIYLAVWFGISLIPAFGANLTGSVNSVAWEAHIGGFLFGFLLFDIFDNKNW
ncbi:rhomboid family intramembrane serine protease [Lentilitoribacter sp. Alg239-R112]|uniref:rhomboid family intramembrane serine protease n=1 Tax=Lentilitoribacter sp. Alg239-R112 TaxID=2305987 RepID=UPI0013A6D86F|nr:rhomboid family intramembrane serine protease [Lentilitoribacter sp. Alg239-R112]